MLVADENKQSVYEDNNPMVFFISLILFVVVMGLLDARLRWPKPNDKTPRYVSVAERSTTLRRN